MLWTGRRARRVRMREGAWILLSVVLLSVRSAGAQTESVAEALFRDARRSMKAGDYAAACPKLAESNRLDPSPGTLLNLAICEEKIGRLATAWTKYRQLFDVLGSSDERRRLAIERAEAIEPRI